MGCSDWKGWAEDSGGGITQEPLHTEGVQQAGAGLGSSPYGGGSPQGQDRDASFADFLRLFKGQDRFTMEYASKVVFLAVSGYVIWNDDIRSMGLCVYIWN